MRQQADAVRAAYRLWKSDSRVGTYAAVVLVLVFLGWPAYRFWKASRRGGGR